jgi:hypothetical protein
LQLPRSSQEKALGSLNRFLIVAAGLCLFMVSIQVLPSIFIRQTEIITVTRIDAARECRSRRTYKIWPKYRSSVPENSLNYCGLIMSDYGSFDLPKTTWINLFGPSREALYDELVTGCSFRIVVTGPGLELAKGSIMSNRNRTLRSAVPLGECATTDAI